MSSSASGGTTETRAKRVNRRLDILTRRLFVETNGWTWSPRPSIDELVCARWAS